jgi:hypothetical protein
MLVGVGAVGTQTFAEIGTMVDAGIATEVGSGMTVEVAVFALLALRYQPSIYWKEWSRENGTNCALGTIVAVAFT